jgi:hypothetical protein
LVLELADRRRPAPGFIRPNVAAGHAGGKPRPVPIARLGQEMLRVTLLALVGFALLRYVAVRWNIPGLKDALGAGGVAQ